MSKYVAFLRAINVPGHVRVRMSDLKDVFTAGGCKYARTFIQSGNVIFDAPGKNIASLCEEVRVRLCGLLGADPGIFLRTVHQLERILKGSPFKAFEAEPNTQLDIAFLSQRPRSKPTFPLLCPNEELDAVEFVRKEADG